jgi:hypothetical protein
MEGAWLWTLISNGGRFKPAFTERDKRRQCDSIPESGTVLEEEELTINAKKT